MGLATIPSEVWGVSFFDNLMESIENGGDIEVLLKNKNEVYIAAQKVDADYLRVLDNIKNLTDKLSVDKNKLQNFDNIIAQMGEYMRNVQELKAIFPDVRPYNSNLQELLEEYLYSGNFDKHYLDKLSARPEKFMDRLKYGAQIKRANRILDRFVEKYTKRNLYELINQNFHGVNANLIKRSLFDQLKHLDFYKHGNETERAMLVQSIEIDRHNLEQHEKVKKYMEDQLREEMDKEDRFVRQFVSDIKKDIMTPPQLNVQDWVERLDAMSDDEMVMFNVRTAANYAKHSQRRAVLNILKYNGLDVGAVEETDKWCYSQGIDTVCHDVELFSPVMRAGDAKQIMPKLLYDLSRAHLSGNLVVAMRPDELLRVVPRRYDNDDAMDTIMNAMRTKQLVYYGDIGDCEKNYLGDEFLFSGAMVSDDYMMLSRRQGRNGIVYATNRLSFAHNYVGISEYVWRPREFYKPEINVNESVMNHSATTDNYREASRCQYMGKKVHVGFITVYQQNESKDRYFNNFGPESAMTARWHGMGDLGKSKTEKGELIETFVTPEKNPVVDKILLIAWNNYEFVIPMNQNMPDDVRAAIQKIISSYTATMEYTLDENAVSDYDHKLVCRHRLDRFMRQKQESDDGIVHTCYAIRKTARRRMNVEQQISAKTVNMLPVNERI